MGLQLLFSLVEFRISYNALLRRVISIDSSLLDWTVFLITVSTVQSSANEGSLPSSRMTEKYLSATWPDWLCHTNSGIYCFLPIFWIRENFFFCNFRPSNWTRHCLSGNVSRYLTRFPFQFSFYIFRRKRKGGIFERTLNKSAKKGSRNGQKI